MKKRRVLVLVHEDLVPPDDLEGLDEKKIRECKTEYDVVSTLRNMGHEARPLGVSSDLAVIREAITEFRPHVCFNLLEEFHGVALYDQHVVSYLELLRQPYTGCNPRGLTLAHDKALSKKLLAYHRIPAPRFKVFPMGRKVVPTSKLPYPVIVKSLTEDASLGISQASVVSSDEKLVERVKFIHDKIGTDAMADHYIDGRELYVGLIGNRRLQTLPIWELEFTKLPEGAARIATQKVKWDEKYQEQIGIVTGPAKNLADGLRERILKLCKRAYRALELTGYARIDLRLTDDGRVYIIEANPNPQLAFDEEFSESAAHVKIKYEDLLQKILNLGISYRVRWREIET
ncbi:MAG: D-alanine--D-alanine ligase family protein [Planctomycetota bacterium]|jgi:D-alanine-D-alanine ligase